MNTRTTTNQRLALLISELQLTQTEFADIIGITKSNLSQMLQGKRPCGKGITDKIKLSFEYVNTSWLLTGDGEMLIGTQNANGAIIQDDNNSNVAIGNNIKQTQNMEQVQSSSNTNQQDALQNVMATINNTMEIYRDLVKTIQELTVNINKDHDQISLLLKTITEKQDESREIQRAYMNKIEDCINLSGTKE